MEYKKTFSLFLGIFLFLNLVTASGHQLTIMPYNPPHNEIIKNNFQNQYQFNCTGTCEFSEEGNQTRLEVYEQKKLFNFINVNMKETYEINEDGEIIKARYNLWSRLLNRNKIKW